MESFPFFCVIRLIMSLMHFKRIGKVIQNENLKK